MGNQSQCHASFAGFTTYHLLNLTEKGATVNKFVHAYLESDYMGCTEVWQNRQVVKNRQPGSWIGYQAWFGDGDAMLDLVENDLDLDHFLDFTDSWKTYIGYIKSREPKINARAVKRITDYCSEACKHTPAAVKTYTYIMVTMSGFSSSLGKMLRPSVQCPTKKSALTASSISKNTYNPKNTTTVDHKREHLHRQPLR